MSRIIAVVSGAIRRLEMRFTPKGTAILDLMMAGKVAQGGAEYLSFAAPRFLGRYAEALAEQVKEGDALLVTGELVQERWEQDGQKRSRPRTSTARCWSAPPTGWRSAATWWTPPRCARWGAARCWAG